jgi:2-methylcitrate dehydratase PrpD
MDVTTSIIKHVLNARFEELPTQAIERAKLSILDTIACSIGGSNDPISHAARQLGDLYGGKSQCTVWASGERLSSTLAVLVNATTARALDFDETYEICINGCHASAYDVPPAIALAECDPSITGREVLSAVTTAMDLHMRLARTITTRASNTGRDNMVAVWGATAVSAKLLRLDEEKLRNAFGIAYAHAAGERQMYEECTHTVALQQGLRARSGLESALSAMVGFTGPREPFFGKYGFFRAFERDHDIDLLMQKLGSEYVGASISFKPWPSCRATHHGIDGLLQLRKNYNFKGEDVASIELGLNRRTEASLAQPREQKWNPIDPVVARFSLPYAVAVAAQHGKVAIPDFLPESLGHAGVRRIMAVTKVEVDPEIERTHGQYGNPPTTVKVRLQSGAEHFIRVDTPFGHPENPASLSDGVRKLRACAEVSLSTFSDNQLELIGEFIDDLENRTSLEPLFELLVGAN